MAFEHQPPQPYINVIRVSEVRGQPTVDAC